MMDVPIDPDALAALLGGHELSIDYGYEEEACSCGEWEGDESNEENLSYHGHLIDVAIAWNERIAKGEE